MNLDPKAPIGVFDSGLGGISVLKRLMEQMPEEDYVFFGDRKNAPYGVKSAKEVLNLTEGAYELFREQGCKAMVIACNTATGVAADALRSRHPDFPILAIEPAVKPAAEAFPGGKILLMATPLAIKTERIRSLARRFQKRASIQLLPCPGLVELIETGHLSDEVLKEKLKSLFEGLEKPDAVVLGCTHFPHVAPAIGEYFGSSVRLFDGGEGVARHTETVLMKNRLKKESGEKGWVRFIFSKGDEKTYALANQLLF
ncbi:MAG: glutamate racemase [Clostridia bacterium]|nr:glutamate racemase [Clostridia bacterium]